MAFMYCGLGKINGQANYSIRHSVNYINKDVRFIFMYYESTENITRMSVIHNRISHYCDSNSLNYLADSFPVEIMSTSNDVDTFIFDSFSNLYFLIIRGYERIYCSIFSNKTVLASKGRLELFLHDTMQFSKTQKRLRLSGDTIDIQSKNDLYVHFLFLNNDKLITNDMKIIVDTMIISNNTVDLKEVKFNIRVDYLKFDDYFILYKSDVKAFKNALRQIYFKNYSNLSDDIHDDDDIFVDFSEINGFLKRRMWISRFHLLFVKRKFKH